MEGVELLLEHEERVWRPGTAHSWEAVDQVAATYTNDITPLTLAAHKVAHGNILPENRISGWEHEGGQCQCGPVEQLRDTEDPDRPRGGATPTARHQVQLRGVPAAQ